MARKKKENIEEVVVTMTPEEVLVTPAENPEAIQSPEVVYDTPQSLEDPATITAELLATNTATPVATDEDDIPPVDKTAGLFSFGDDANENPNLKDDTATEIATIVPTDTIDAEAMNDMEEAMMAFIETVTKSVAAPAIPSIPEVSTGTITVNDLAAEFGIEPKSLRSRLRKNGYKKAGKTWGWSPDSAELTEIRAKFTRKLEPAQPVPTPPVSVTE